jgi:hypothetical protein
LVDDAIAGLAVICESFAGNLFKTRLGRDEAAVSRAGVPLTRVFLVCGGEICPGTSTAAAMPDFLFFGGIDLAFVQYQASYLQRRC